MILSKLQDLAKKPTNREKSISEKKDFEMKKKAVLLKCWITSKTAPLYLQVSVC